MKQAKPQVVIPPAQVIMPHCDRERRTCIQVERTALHVKFIPLDVSTGLEVHLTTISSFSQRFNPMKEYPVEKACRLFLSYSQTIGATKEALGYLGQVISISEQEIKMATRKKQVTTEKSDAAKVVAKAAAKKPLASTKPVAGKATAGKTVAKPTTGKTAAVKDAPKRLSAAQMFQDLIMEGKLTDDAIFEEVKEAYGLDEKKRGYVKWYRNHLAKQGMNPPKAK